MLFTSCWTTTTEISLMLRQCSLRQVVTRTRYWVAISPLYVPIVYCCNSGICHDRITLFIIPITYGLVGPPVEVKALYRLVKHQPSSLKTASYVDAWDLRRLYTFSFRRQRDAAKRKQTPRDWMEWVGFSTHPVFSNASFLVRLP